MLVTKLDPTDLQFERARSFDGTFAYAQNKVSQTVGYTLLARPERHYGVWPWFLLLYMALQRNTLVQYAYTYCDRCRNLHLRTRP